MLTKHKMYVREAEKTAKSAVKKIVKSHEIQEGNIMPRKGENIYKRKDNRWEARYIKGHAPDGSARYGYCYGRSYKEAKEKVTRIKAELLTNKTIQAEERKRFLHYCNEWLQLNRSMVKESTLVKYATIIEKHIKPTLGGCHVQSITSLAVEQFGHELLTDKGLSPKTVRDILTLLRSIMKYAAKQTPGVQLVDISLPKDAKKEMRILTKDEQRNFIRYLTSEPDECKFGVLLALLTGMRIGEICALRWQDISLTEKTIKVSSTMQRLKNLDEAADRKTKVVIVEPKSESSARVIPLTEYTAELCRRWEVNDPAAFVLTGKAERYIEPRTLQYCMEKYTKACNIEGVHFHALRHTFATRCVEVGFEIKSLSEILGHSSPRITLERYVHSSIELKRENMNKLSALGY